MKRKQVIFRQRADFDIDSAFKYYVAEAGASVALAFVDSLEDAITHLSRHPPSGSTRYAYELDIPGLRSWPLKRFPYLIFYVNMDTHVEVWRLLHSQSDIPEWMQDADD